MCVQERKQKGSKAKGIGDRYKRFYSEIHSKRNGVGKIFNKELKEKCDGGEKRV